MAFFILNSLCTGAISNLYPESQVEELLGDIELPEGMLTAVDYQRFYWKWEQFNPDRSQYIRLDQLSDFLHFLAGPWDLVKPNKYKIICLDLTICRGDIVHRQDILDEITRDYYFERGFPGATRIERTEEVTAQLRAERPGWDPVSSTLWRQRENFCAKIIQQAWRRHKNGAQLQRKGRRQNQSQRCICT